MSDNTDKRTATQRIEDLEKVVTTLYQNLLQIKNATENLIRAQGEMGLVKDALKILNKKTEAIILAANADTGITLEAVSSLVVKMNVQELTDQVTGYVSSGQLTPNATEVAENSFLVCEEVNAEGQVFNPRVQFRFDSQKEETKNALKGKNVGDLVSFGENKLGVRVLELYTIVEPKALDATTSTEAAPAPESAATTGDASAETAPTTAPTGPSNDNFASPPAETPVATFVSDAGSVTATA